MSERFDWNRFFNGFFAVIFSVVIASCIYVIISTRNLNAQIYLIPFWSAPIALEAVIGCGFFLFLLYRFKDWRISLCSLILFDLIWEFAYAIYSEIIEPRFAPSIYDYISYAILLSLFLYFAHKFKIQFKYPFLLETIGGLLVLNWFLNMKDYFSFILLEIILALGIWYLVDYQVSSFIGAIKPHKNP